MKELSLFSGAGGGLLGTKLLGWEHCGYVEFNDYCQRIIEQRIEDGIFDRAPIFGDINTFIGDGYADAYQGLVDVVTAGFPCQPFSVAGKRSGEDDSRNMWPQTIDVIRRVRPRFVFLENTPGLSKYWAVIRDDLKRLGYVVPPRARVSAAALGAPHIRRRDWIFAYSDSHELRIEYWWSSREKRQNKKILKRIVWWSGEPGICRVADGVANRVDRLKALGNGQVPIVAATAWELLNRA